MKKLELKDWAEFVRGVATAERQRSMEELLAAGDEESVRLHQMALGVVAARDFVMGTAVPEEVVARAKGIFAKTPKESVFSWPSLPVSLVFDSFLTPQPAGLRAAESAYREAIYQAGDLQLSVRVEQEPGTDVVAVVGQLVGDERRRESVASRPVMILQKEKIVARTLSGVNGEFQLEFIGRYPLRLVVGLNDPERRVDVELEPFAEKRLKRSPGKKYQ